MPLQKILNRAAKGLSILPGVVILLFFPVLFMDSIETFIVGALILAGVLLAPWFAVYLEKEGWKRLGLVTSVSSLLVSLSICVLVLVLWLNGPVIFGIV